MTRDIKDIITDMREIVKPCISQMLFNENFEGKGNTDKAEFETEFEMILTLAERGATVEAVPMSVIEKITETMEVEYASADELADWFSDGDKTEASFYRGKASGIEWVKGIIYKAVKEYTHE